MFETNLTTTTSPVSRTVLQSDPYGASIDLGSIPRCPPAPLPSNGKTIMTIGCPDAQRVEYADLAGVPVPRPGMRTLKDGSQVISHQPVAFRDAADLVRSVMAHELGVRPVSESYALAGFDRETGIPSELAGKIVFPYGEPGRYLEVALLGSTGKSIAWHAAIGEHTSLCANGMISGDCMIKLKSTSNVAERFPAMLQEVAARAERAIREIREKMSRWASTACGADMFFALLGVLQGRGDIDGPTANAARKYWAACRKGVEFDSDGRPVPGTGVLHAEHASDTLLNAVQALTGAFHRVAPRAIFRANKGTDTVVEAFARSGGSASNIPQVDLDIEEF